MKTFKINDTECTLFISEYYDGNLAILIECDEGDYDDLTVNLADFLLPNFAYINPSYEKVVKELGIAKPSGVTRQSGFVSYPLYEFDINKAEEYGVIA